ncbi:MAG: tetratricopeptide repeat protein [Deltaproteobacteria bacterium]|nr:tetratricopeptide repeat protein [Deltaproteobacteria bacterium]MBW2360332.1 tetratricopeptide repeat protein [Deltaproteobacteria bacterium]
MRLIRISIFCILALALSACQDDAAKVAQHLERGESYLEAEQYGEAIIELKSVLQIDPNHGGAHYKLAHAYFRARKPRDGFWELRETVRLDPSNQEARIEFSQLAILAGEAEESLSQMESLIAEDSSDVRAHLVRAQALDSLKRFDEAHEVYLTAYEVSPEDQGALRGVARSLQRTGAKEAALARYEELIEKHPNFVNYSQLARVIPSLLPEGQDGAARREELLRLAIDGAEGDERPRAYEQLASLFMNQERAGDAHELLSKGVESEEDPVPVLYLLARLHRSEGNENEAEALLQRAALERPDDPQVHLVLASYLVRQDQFDGALVAIGRALELDPSEKRALLQKAEVLMELGFRHDREGGAEEARQILDQILAEEPSNGYALVADGKYKLGTGDLSGATRALRAALETQPNWAQAYYLLGLALAAQQDFPAARNEFAKSLELDASQVRAKAALAEAHFRLGEWSYCVERSRDYLKVHPEDNGARLMLAQSLVRLDRISEAETELNGIPDELRNGEILFALGRIQESKRDLDGAREYMLAAHEALPGNWEVLQALLVLDRLQGRLQESTVRIAAALEAKPDDAKLHQLNALVAFNEGRADDAEQGFLRAIELAPDDLQAYQRLARFYARMGRLEQTAAIYEQALEKNPESATVHHFLGVLYELSGDTSRAIERYESAIEYGPDMAEAKNNLAYLYAEQGQNLDRALDLAQDAKGLMPDNPSVSDTLGWVLYKRGVASAAISYLKEAETRTAAGDASIGVIRYHLALAHEASDEPAEALEAVNRSLQGLDEIRQAAEGEAPPEPDWAAEARALRQRLEPGVASNS